MISNSLIILRPLIGVIDTPAAPLLLCCLANKGVYFSYSLGLIGRTEHVTRLVADPAHGVEGILVLEMIGYYTEAPESPAMPVRIPLPVWPPKTGNFVLVVGDIPLGGISNRFESAARRYEPQLDYYSANCIGGFFRDAARSDHYPYWVAGLRGVFLTDTSNFRNSHNHLASDTVDTLNFTFMGRITRTGAATMMERAGSEPGADAESQRP